MTDRRSGSCRKRHQDPVFLTFCFQFYVVVMYCYGYRFCFLISVTIFYFFSYNKRFSMRAHLVSTIVGTKRRDVLELDIEKFKAKRARQTQEYMYVVLTKPLVNAIGANKSLDDIERLLADAKLDTHVPVQTPNGQKNYTPLFAAIYFHNYDVVRLLVESNRVDINKIDHKTGHCAVTFAASLCESNTGEAVRVFKYLYEKNTPYVDRAFGQSGQTAAMELARDETLELLEYVKQRGADLNILDGVGENIIAYAFYRRDAKSVPDADANADCLRVRTTNTIRKLVELGVDINRENDDGETPLDLATRIDQKWAIDQIRACGGKFSADCDDDDDAEYEDEDDE